MKRAATLISYLFHPLLLPTYSLLYLILINPYWLGGWDGGNNGIALAIVIINSLFFPVVTILLMKKLEFIDSYQMYNRADRIFPMIAVMFFIFWTYLVISRMEFPELFSDIFLGTFLATIFAFVLTVMGDKISLHGIGMGVLTVITFISVHVTNYNVLPFVFLVILLSGVVLSSRLLLKAHTEREVYWGFMTGFTAQMMAFVV